MGGGVQSSQSDDCGDLCWSDDDRDFGSDDRDFRSGEVDRDLCADDLDFRPDTACSSTPIMNIARSSRA